MKLPEDELQQRGIGALPATLGEAADALEKDEVIKNALGTEYADYYIQVKREEWRNYHWSVSQWRDATTTWKFINQEPHKLKNENLIQTARLLPSICLVAIYIVSCGTREDDDEITPGRTG